jgi:hypothetical protein
MDKIRSQEHGRELHEEFHRELANTTDRFSVVAQYFGRGVFNKVLYLYANMSAVLLIYA